MNANYQFDAVYLFIYLFILTYLNSLIVSQIRQIILQDCYVHFYAFSKNFVERAQ